MTENKALIYPKECIKVFLFLFLLPVLFINMGFRMLQSHLILIICLTKLLQLWLKTLNIVLTKSFK